MKTINVGELKANFSEVLKKVQSGEEIGILYGKEKKLWQSWFPGFPQKNIEEKLVFGIRKALLNLILISK